MLGLFGRVVAELRARGISHALIGASAMAVHGASRSTFDIDLLLTDRAALSARVWEPLRESGASVDVRVGDAEDPLAGVVRVTAAGERAVDLVVGRHQWQADAIARAQWARLATVDVPVAALADLVLLKLYAGGPQDAWDVQQLLALDHAGTVAAEVEMRLDRLPPESAALWARIKSRGP